MPSDLSYFYERDMSEGSMEKFFHRLPNPLQRLFEDSFERSISDNTDFVNLLQGYRGPHNNGATGDSGYLGPSNGLQEVRYWWGISKNMMLLLPPFGLLAFAIGRAVQNTDWHSLYFDSKTGECLSHNKNEACEKLNNKGNKLLQEGKYTEAAEYYNNAHLNCSSGYKNETTFKNNKDEAKIEIDAKNLNSEGDNLFSQEKYVEAFNKYKMAYEKSQISKECIKYSANRDKAKAESDSTNLSSDGENLFSQSKYSEALIKYQEAYDKSQVHKDIFRAKRAKAEAEIYAINLSIEGENLFKQGKYSIALRKYQAAYEKSVVEKEKNKYAISKNNVQNLQNKLSIIDTLWKKAWEVENDSDNDRSSQATELFERVLSETKNAIKIFTDHSILLQWETLVSLKIYGNELFNMGLELLQEAEKLKLHQKLNLAHVKYTEAKSKFSKAQEKFKIGKENDQQFLSCVDFVHDQLNGVLQMIEDIEQQTVSSTFLNLNVTIRSDHPESDFCQNNITRDYNNYYKQI